MANDPMKSCFTITQAQQNANQKYNEILPHTVRMPPINSTRNSRCWEGVVKGDPHAQLVEQQPAASTLENSMEGPQGVKHRVALDPATALLGIYLKHMKTRTQKDTCTPLFLAALFTRSKYNPSVC